MKIKVTPEGREEIYLADKESLKEYIKSVCGEKIHNFVGTGPVIIGADHDKEDVLEDIDKAERIAILIGLAKRHNVGHALALIIGNKLEMYDIGDITSDNLEVTK